MLGMLISAFRTYRLTGKRESLSQKLPAVLDDSLSAEKLDKDRIASAMDVSNEYIWDLDVLTGRLYLAPRTSELLGCVPDSLPISHEGWLEWVHHSDIQLLDNAMRSHILGMTPIFEADYRIRDTLGNARVIKSRGKVERNGDGTARIIGTHLDITRLRNLEQRIGCLQRYQETLRSIGDGLITTDTTGCITFMNSVAEVVTGWSAEEAQGMPISSVLALYDEQTREMLDCPVGDCLSGKQTVQISDHALLINRLGREIAVSDSTNPIRDSAGKVIGAVIVFRNVSEQRAKTRVMSWQLTHDELTGLVSRREFERILDVLISDATLNDHEHALMHLDLDQFKTINDTCGHAAGDELLRQVASLLKDQIRHDDTLGRLQGDEFAVLMEHSSSEAALVAAEKLRTAISGFRFEWQQKIYVIGVTIGVVIINKDSNYTAATAMGAADMTCYEAKDHGRNRVFLCQKEDVYANGRESHSQILTAIRIALTEDRFELLGQRILALGVGEEDHYEVLLRMVDQYGMLIPPNEFIPIAERYGLMPEVDKWVVSKSMAILAGCNGRAKPVGLSINLSGLSFTKGMLDFIKSEIARTGVPPERLCFEITETAALRHVGLGTDFMHQLKEIGCRFSLDDFGVGMSSFTYLKLFPVDVLKIDGSFVKAMLNDSVDNAIVSMINTLGQIMGKETIAEYVEDERTLNALRMIGVDHAQGYIISKPSSLSSLLADQSGTNGGGSATQIIRS